MKSEPEGPGNPLLEGHDSPPRSIAPCADGPPLLTPGRYKVGIARGKQLQHEL